MAAQEVLEPVDQVLKRLRGESLPLRWYETLEHAVGQVIESLRHTDLTDKSSLKVCKRCYNNFKQNVESLKFLKQHDLSGCGHLELLLDVEDIKNLGQLLLNF